MFDLTQINLWGTIAAAMATYALGALWYSPALFGKAWFESLGKRKEEMTSPVLAMGLTLVTTVVTAFALALLFQIGGIDSTGRGLVAGGIVGAGVVGVTSFSDALFAGQIRIWWLIGLANRLAGFLLMGAIIGASAPENKFRSMERQMHETESVLQDKAEEIGNSLLP